MIRFQQIGRQGQTEAQTPATPPGTAQNAPVTAMQKGQQRVTPDHSTTVRLGQTHKILIGLVVAGALVIAGIGFAGSYAAVRELALKKGFGNFA
ncbi:DUF2637 domain-containing protein, partial [Streptomyces sp. NPDC048448]|uniref:DUF2637 domain-containing protein n=1 Tax=Streptomyces sp. NPDC048448 TaxID=3365554 RepID=UPI003712B469